MISLESPLPKLMLKSSQKTGTKTDAIILQDCQSATSEGGGSLRQIPFSAASSANAAMPDASARLTNERRSLKSTKAASPPQRRVPAKARMRLKFTNEHHLFGRFDVQRCLTMVHGAGCGLWGPLPGWKTVVGQDPQGAKSEIVQELFQACCRFFKIDIMPHLVIEAHIHAGLFGVQFPGV